MKGILLTILIALSGCAENKEIYYINNTVLYDLGTLTEVAQYLYNNPPADIEVTRKIESMIYSKIFIVKNSKVKLSELQAVSLKGLCESLVLSKNPHFGSSVNDESITDMIKIYLNQIQPELKTASDKLKSTVLSDATCII
jgi:hypothetical protein